jgi:hypothetical protein
MSEEPLPYNPQQTSASPQMPVIRMGALIAIMLIAYTLLLYITGQGTNKYMGWISYALMSIGLWLATKNYRDDMNGGIISYGRAYLVSFLTALYCSIIYGVFAYFYFKFLARDTMQEMITIAEQEMLNNTQISEEQATQAMDIYKKYVFIPFSLAVGSIFSFALLGALLSLLIASITQRKTIDTPQA